jgi:intein/homing endonuclease
MSQYQGLILATKILLVDGRILTLDDVITEYDNGKVNYVYNQDEFTFQLESGMIEWAGKTNLLTKVVEIGLSNGKTVTATPNHVFISGSGERREAKDLFPDFRLMALDYSKSTNRKLLNAFKKLIINILHPNIKNKYHKVTSLKWLTNLVTTGNIKVSSRSHSHIFAIEAGVFVHNTSDTRVPTVPTEIMVGHAIP